MLTVLLILLYFLAPIIIVFFRFVRPKLGIYWFVSLIVAIVAWLVLLLSISHLPASHLGPGDTTLLLANFQFTFSLDSVSWPIAFSLSAFVLGVILTSTTNLLRADQNKEPALYWVLTFVYAGLSLWAIFAVNIFTLLIAWSAIDLLWFFYKLITQVRRRMILIGFTFRLMGTFLVMSAVISNSGSQMSLSFPIVTNQAFGLFFFGSWLRFISLGLDIHPNEKQANLSFQNSVHFIPLAASTIILLVRNSFIDPPADPHLFWLGITALSGLIASILFLFGRNKTLILFSSIIGLFAFTTIAYLLGETYAVSAWGVALILAASMLSFYSLHHRNLMPILLVSFLGITALPFTPAWQGIRIFPPLGEIPTFGYNWIFTLFASALIWIAFIRNTFSLKKTSFSLERWSWIVYILGLALLPITHVIVLLIGVPGLSNRLEAFPNLNNSWPSVLILGMVVMAFLVNYRNPRLVDKVSKQLDGFSPANWLVITLDKILTFCIHFVRFIDRIIEGEGGILWTVLFLLLLVTLYIQLIP